MKDSISSVFNRLCFRTGTLFQRSRLNADLEEELRSHIEHRADDLERSGLDRAQAERRARVEFGGREKYKEEIHEALGGNFLEILMQDIRYSRQPGAGFHRVLGNAPRSAGPFRSRSGHGAARPAGYMDSSAARIVD